MNVLVTGAGRGIGRSIALAFGRAGHRVGVNVRSRRAEGEAVVAEIRALGAQGDLFPADVADPRQAQEMVDRVVSDWGRLDGLVNNAGITRDRALLSLSTEEWREVLDVNLSGSFYCLRAAARHMAKSKSGFVVNIGSIIGWQGEAGCANYAASKAGLVGLTRAAARELGRWNIRINLVLPGFHKTEMSAGLPAAHVDRVTARHTLGRCTDINDLTGLILWLAGTTTVSGQVFNADSRILA